VLASIRIYGYPVLYDAGGTDGRPASLERSEMTRGPSELFKALSDQTRLDMLALLLERGELCVCDFEQALQIGQSKASRHLRYLVNAGLLTDHREGIWMHYALRRDLGEEQSAVLRAVPGLLGETHLLQLRRSLEQWLKQKKETPGTCGQSQSGRPCLAAGD